MRDKPPQGIPGGRETVSRLSGTARVAVGGGGGRTPAGSTPVFLSRTRPPSRRQPRRQRLLPFPGAQGPPPAASATLSIHSPSRPRPSTARRGALAFGRANGLSSPLQPRNQSAPAEEASPAVRLLPGPQDPLFGESQAGIELASLPGGSAVLPPRLGVGLRPSGPGFATFHLLWAFGTRWWRVLRVYPRCNGSSGMGFGCPD